MNLNDLMKLVDAGFSKQEIMQMVSAEQPATPAPAPDPEPEKPSTPPEPVPAPTVQTPDPAADAIAKLTQQVTQLTTLVQQTNLLRAEQPNVTPQKAEDIIGSIIFPTYKSEQ